MINIIDKRDCCGCYACICICPQQCIKMQSDEEGFWYPVADVDTCINCSLCELVCPIIVKEDIVAYNVESLAYACINTDEQIRRQSSSGGLFTVLAEQIINNNGVVFGAVFDDEFNVVHSWTDCLEELNKFRGSKYVQSRVGDTYQVALNFLKQGRQVLFSGTPCQIAGLRSYLGKNYDGLFLVDIICHGVPSPHIWHRYKKQLEERFKAKAQKINFRSKSCGWKLYSVSFFFDNEIEYCQTHKKDTFMQGFLQNLYLRPSCYACNFKSINRQSDITLGDFWGIEKILPQMDDDQGTSLVMVHSTKGQAMFSSIEDRVNYEKVNYNKVTLTNSAYVNSMPLNPKREKFFAELPGTDDINKLIIKYTRVNLFRKLYLKARNLASKVKRKVIS